MNKFLLLVASLLAFNSFAEDTLVEAPEGTLVEPGLSEETVAADSIAADATDLMTAEEFVASLHGISGKITLPGNIATMNLSDQFLYIDPDNTERLLVDGWGNPPGNKTLGMIIPANVSPLDYEGWGVVITYMEDGYVSDEDADDIDYDELLKNMMAESREASKQREEAGYGSMTLIGWAESPRYDQQTHKFYWAKEYVTSGADVNSLNYNIRVLGRKGVLVLNAVATMDQIDSIKHEMPDLLAVTNFTQGNRYEDFDSSVDHVAEYGLAALVAGGVAAKMGLFAKLGALLLVFKKFIIVGIALVGGVIARLFGRKKD
ncbi:DUF2167 domain-containing protein [Gynuella sp.]|uniref:DUF2167 domain-containing protein n=1 Tax=Gynuella sp. TaxID=2969146 RepID=UPI003D11A83E